MYLIVEFKHEGNIYGVPDSWVVGNKCLWPPYKTDQRVFGVTKSREILQSSWTLHDINVLSKVGVLFRKFVTFLKWKLSGELPPQEWVFLHKSDILHNNNVGLPILYTFTIRL